MTPADLKACRAKLGLTQAELAAYLKVAPNTVARWEREVLALPPFLSLALETVAFQVEEKNRQRGPGRPPKRRRPTPGTGGGE